MKPEDNQKNLDKCICDSGECGVYNAECAKEKEERLFCARKKTGCTFDATKMCICGMCKIFQENSLDGGYFCINEIKEEGD